jgi:hypothetical protein
MNAKFFKICFIPDWPDSNGCTVWGRYNEGLFQWNALGNPYDENAWQEAPAEIKHAYENGHSITWSYYEQ